MLLPFWQQHFDAVMAAWKIVMASVGRGEFWGRFCWLQGFSEIGAVA